MADADEFVLGSEGWDQIDLDGEFQASQRAHMQTQALEFASYVRRTFASPEGQIVLRRLVESTVLRPIVSPNASQFEAGIREGRADLVRQILRNIELAERGFPQTGN